MPNRHFRCHALEAKVLTHFSSQRETFMTNVAKLCSTAVLALAWALSAAPPVVAESPVPAPSASGIITTRSAYDVAETVDRLKKDIAAKGIVFFDEIDQASLAAKAGIEL